MYVIYTHFLRSTPGAPLPVSPLTQSISQSDWAFFSVPLSLSVCLGQGAAWAQHLDRVYIGSAWVMGVWDQHTSWPHLYCSLSVQCILLAGLAVVLCSILAYCVLAMLLVCIAWLLVCALYVYRGECRWARGHCFDFYTKARLRIGVAMYMYMHMYM